MAIYTIENVTASASRQVPAAGEAREHGAVTFCMHARIAPRQITRNAQRTAARLLSIFQTTLPIFNYSDLYIEHFYYMHHYQLQVIEPVRRSNTQLLQSKVVWKNAHFAR